MILQIDIYSDKEEFLGSEYFKVKLRKMKKKEFKNLSYKKFINLLLEGIHIIAVQSGVTTWQMGTIKNEDLKMKYISFLDEEVLFKKKKKIKRKIYIDDLFLEIEKIPSAENDEDFEMK